MTRNGRQRILKWLAAIGGGIMLFAFGLAILHFNPYWRSEPDLPGVIDHRVYPWNGTGHFVSALGLLSIFATAAYTVTLALSRQFITKWLYWSAVALVICCVTAWLAMNGVLHYNASFHWDSSAGVTAFKVVLPPEEWPNPLWQQIVRWQIEPELNGYLGGGRTLERTDGEVEVTVLKIIPIATPTALGSDGEVLHNVERRKP
jgi:hypothetical protein